VSNNANGKSNQNIPVQVWLYILVTLIRRKYSKSGVTEPIINPVMDIHFSGKYFAGNIRAGCENVSGIVS